MIRTFRGAWSRRGTLLPLLLLTMVVVTGAVTTIGFAQHANTSAALAVPLFVLGAFAVPATGRELAAARRGEIAIARLRGLQGGELTTLLAVEPLLVLLAGGAAGLVLGSAGSWLATAVWTDGPGGLPGLTAVLAGLGIVAVGLVATMLGMLSALREPLNLQVSIASRPHPAGTGAIFADVLIVVGAVVAVYRSGVADPGHPDVLVLAGPALVGLAIGQLIVWLVRISARLAVGRTANGGLTGFLGVRRLARVADAATPIRALVAAAVVAALALTGATEVNGWTDDTARLRSGAPLRVDVDEDAVGALALTRDLDPDGRYLLAAVLVPGEGSAAARRAFLDTSRYAAVLGDFYAGTPAAAIADQVDGLGGADSSVASGDTVTATVQGVSARTSGVMRPRVVVAYLDEHGTDQRAEIGVDLPLTGAAQTGSAALTGCDGGCVITSVTLARTRGDRTLPWVLTALDFGGTDAMTTTWKPAFPGRFGQPGGPVVVDEGLLAPASDRPLVAEPLSSGPKMPVLATPSVTFDGRPQLDSTGGDERPAQVLATLPALPLVEADGLLADLPRAAAGAPPTVPAAQVMVLARADTPAALLAQLTDAAGHDPRTLNQVDAAVADETGATQARVYSLMAVFCLVAALLVLAAAVGRQRAAWAREVAALRVVGVDLATLRGSGRLEILWLATAAVLATVGGALLAVRLLLAHLSLVDVPAHSVPLVTGVAAWPLVVAAVVVAGVVLVVNGRGRALHPDRTRPAILREEGSA
ncbi:FtsX-like permease family protein [Nocardioides sp. LS1]|uniref:FtsX-like permease family protein n=1 Tax=Nocardioides sp. LS1 TaxID=1027620 RepID=UPI000F61AB8F|nr:FtsX-like permease family protein [Nocardioides sp. LS1]GCD90280.1 hypothetical protein NLS1_22860 [Nocardioides sp. LS1]